MIVETGIEVLRTYMELETLSTFNVFVNKSLILSGKGLELKKGDGVQFPGCDLCIAEGCYDAIKEESSPGHNYPHLRVLGVLHRQGILWHGGNYFTDTKGCYLPGDSFGDRNKDGILDVLNSRTTLARICALLPTKFKILYKEKGE